MRDDVENRFQRGSGIIWLFGRGQEKGVCDFNHFLSVWGKQVKGSEISGRRVLVGFWKNAWPTWRPRRGDTGTSLAGQDNTAAARPWQSRPAP